MKSRRLFLSVLLILLVLLAAVGAAYNDAFGSVLGAKPAKKLRELRACLPGGSKSVVSATVEHIAPTVHLDQSDPELLRIAENARDTLPAFFRRMHRPAKGDANFRLKYPFRTDSGSGFSMEQLWLGDISFKDGVYYGVLQNMPFYIGSLKKGDTVSFSADEITDWMYTSNGKITGGRSIKYLLEGIPPLERGEEQWRLLQMFD